MKGLLLKDGYTLLRQAKFFVCMIVMFAIIPDKAVSAASVVYAAMLPVTALAYDQRAKWDSLATMMPYSVRNLVLSKYVLGYIGIALAVIFVSAARFAAGVVLHTAAAPESYLSLLFTAVIATLILAFNLPLMFRFGVERGRMAFVTVLMIGSAVSFGAKEKIFTFSAVSAMGLEGLVLIAVLLTVFINIVSVFLSMTFYKRRAD